MADTDPEEVLDIPPDAELEADFDPHEEPTRNDRVGPCVPSADFRILLATVVALAARCNSPARDTERSEETRAALTRLCAKYGVE